MQAFWQVVRAHNPQLADAHKVNFWESTLSTRPDQWGQPPIDREPVYTYVEGEATGAGQTRLGAETLTSTGE
jgi:hypothetical protein